MSDVSNGGGRRLAVFAVSDGGREDGKSRWTRIGVAFDNKDGSVNLLLNAFPIGTAKLQVREEREEDRTPAARRTAPRAEEARS